MTLDQSIRQLLQESLGMPEHSVRPANWENGGQGAPTGPRAELFATVLVTSFMPEGWDEVRQANEPAPSLNVQETVDGQRTVVASVQFFRKGALALARRVKGALSTSNAAYQAQEAGLGLHSVGAVMDLSQVVDTLFEERARVMVTFSAGLAEVNSLETYGTFPISISTIAETASFEVQSP